MKNRADHNRVKCEFLRLEKYLWYHTKLKIMTHRAPQHEKDENLELKKMPTKHFENETFQIFRKIVDVDTCQESDISLKTSVAYRLVNSDPRGPNRTYYVSLLNIRKNEVYFEIHFSVIKIRTVRGSTWISRFGLKKFI